MYTPVPLVILKRARIANCRVQIQTELAYLLDRNYVLVHL